LAFRIIKILATTPGKHGQLVFAAGLAVVTGLYWGIEKNPVADMLAGHDKLKKLARLRGFGPFEESESS